MANIPLARLQLRVMVLEAQALVQHLPACSYEVLHCALQHIHTVAQHGKPPSPSLRDHALEHVGRTKESSTVAFSLPIGMLLPY